MPAWKEVWEAIAVLASRAAQKAATIEADAKRKARELVAGASAAVKQFMTQYEGSTKAERDALSTTPTFEAVRTLADNRAVQDIVKNSTEEGGLDYYLLKAAGLAKGLKVPGSGAALG